MTFIVRFAALGGMPTAVRVGMSASGMLAASADPRTIGVEHGGAAFGHGPREDARNNSRTPAQGQSSEGSTVNGLSSAMRVTAPLA